jgi:D-glycero-D-manno-heptose 1,7-bisphosphate phosphatase
MSLVKNKSYLANTKLSNLAIKKKLILFDKNSKLMNGGVYLIRYQLLKHIKNKFLSLEDDIIPKFINEKKVEGRFFSGFFYDIGTPKNLINAGKVFKKYLKRPAVFLDRDNVINYDKNGYLYKISDFIFKSNVIKALKFLNDKKYYIFLITNQAGIAKGKYTIKDFVNLSKYIKSHLSKKKIYIDEVKFCPHHPKGILKNFKKKCYCRKPQNKLFKEIIKDYEVDIEKSFMIGDKSSDEGMAIKSKLYFEFDYSNLLDQVQKITKIL